MQPHDQTLISRSAAAPASLAATTKVAFLANSAWYLHNFQRGLVDRVREAGGDPLLISPDGPDRPSLERGEAPWQELRLARNIAPLADLRSLLDLIAIYRREQPMIAHHFTTKGVVYGTIAALVTRVPVIVNTINGLGFVFGSESLKARLVRPLLSAALRLLLRPAHVQVMFQNPDDRRAFIDRGIVDAERAALTHGSGVDTGLFRPARRPRSSPVRVLMPARLLWEKGVGEYVAAARHLAGRTESIRFLLAGASDPDNPGAVGESALEAWRREGHVEMLGYCSDMPALLRTVDIVALPSYREGAPRALLEAAASGLPVVTTDVPGCRHLVRQGIEGEVVPVRDAMALANAIARLADDQVTRRAMGARARARALQQFDTDQVARVVLSAYGRGLTRSAPRAPRRSKRLFDVVVSAAGLLSLAPLWGLIAIAIKAEDRGPILFRQSRWGRGGERFEVLKFRSMKVGAAALQPASELDPRVTRVGRLLRATALDELPQLLNILRGDMSVVGPRPLAVGEVQPDGSRYESTPGFDYRLSVRPGLTSPAAIYLPKDAAPRRKFAYDRLYVRRHGLWLDLRLILLSFWITTQGAWESRDRRNFTRKIAKTKPSCSNSHENTESAYHGRL